MYDLYGCDVYAGVCMYRASDDDSMICDDCAARARARARAGLGLRRYSNR